MLPWGSVQVSTPIIQEPIAAIDLPPHLAYLATQTENTKPADDEPYILQTKIDESCIDKKCLEDTYGPNAVDKIIAMFTMAGISLPPHLAHLANQIENTKPANDEPHILQTKIDERCTDKKCLEDTYGPNAVNMIIAMFTMAGIDLPPHLAHLANQIENTKPASETQ